MDFQPLPGRIVLTISADPVLDPDLCDGAVRLLLLIRSLAGHSRVLVTLTQSLATQLRRHPDTIRAWRGQLEAGGYISHHTDPRTGRTTIMLCEPVEPPSRRALMAAQRAEDAKPAPLPWQTPRLVILKPDPRPWGTLPQIRPWREIRGATVMCHGGAWLRRHIKPSRILSLTTPSLAPACDDMEATPTRAGTAWQALPPVRTPAEQIAALTSAPVQATSCKSAAESSKAIALTGSVCLWERAARVAIRW